MTQSVPSTINLHNRFQMWVAAGGPVNLWSLIRHRSGELIWVLGSKLGLLGANAALMLFLVNRLELKTYGLLVITISAQLLISRLLMLGVDGGMLRLIAVPELAGRSQALVASGLVFISVTSGVLIGIMVVATPVLAQFAVPVWVFPVIVAGAIGTSLVDYGYSYRLARHDYYSAALAQGGTAVWRMCLVIILAVTLPEHSFALFLAYHGASLLSGLFQTLLIFRVSERPDRALIKRLVRYSFWIGEANVVVIFSLYQGTFLLMVLQQTAATGLFGLALTFSLGFFAIASAYSEYLAVRIRSIANQNQIPRFMWSSGGGALILVFACVPILFVVVVLMRWFLTPDRLEVIPVFVFLSASMVVLILQAPLSAVSHFLLRPQLITVGWVIRAVLIGIAGVSLAPSMGATGAAIAQLIGAMLALLILSWLVLASWRSASAKERAAGAMNHQ